MKFLSLLAAASLAVALITGCSPRDAKHPKFVVAEIGKTKITRAQLDEQIGRMIKRIGMSAEQLNEDQQSSLAWFALNDMVDREVVRQSLTPEQAAEISQKASERLEGIRRQFADEEMYRRALESEGLSEEEILADLTHQSALQMLSPAASSTTEEARAFYDANPELWKSPEQVRARHVLVRTEPNASIEQANASKKAADAARARVARGEDFAKVAAEVSEDPGSKAQGGELPPFGRGQMVPEFEKAAFETAPGKISPVFRTDFGYHFLQVLEKKAARTIPFEEVSSRIQQAVGQQKQVESARKLMADLRAQKGVKIHLPEPPTEPPASAPSDSCAK